MEITKNKVVELINAVEETNLTKDQLENYRDTLSSMFARIQMELADIEKVEAVFFAQKHQDLSLTDVAIKRQWKAGEFGQRGIDLKAWSKGIEKLLASLKSRLYSLY
jgi:hypothetical protein